MCVYMYFRSVALLQITCLVVRLLKQNDEVNLKVW